MSKLTSSREGGRFKGRRGGRKCGDVDGYLSDHGNVEKCESRWFIHSTSDVFSHLPKITKATSHFPFGIHVCKDSHLRNSKPTLSLPNQKYLDKKKDD